MDNNTPQKEESGIYSERGADNLCKVVFNLMAATSLAFFLNAFNGQALNKVEGSENTESLTSGQIMPAWKANAMGAASGVASLLTFGVWARHRRAYPHLAEDKKKGGGNDNDDNSSFDF